MTKFVKIVYICFCFGICNLRSETYNVITVSRTPNNYQGYDCLAPEEIYLVFAQLARCFPRVNIATLTPPSGWSPQVNTTLETYVPPKVDQCIPTIIVFNETFFGKDNPLSNEKVEEILSIYENFALSHMPRNIHLYVNFLYTKTWDGKRDEQIRRSMRRYEEVAKTRDLPQFCFPEGITGETIRSYVEKCQKGPERNQTLLFNQTKIFHGSTLIGYYNKSSYFEECRDTLIQNLYYVLGNFETHYLPDYRFFPPVDCLTCYDIAVLPDKMYPKNPMFKNPICAFSSNSTNALSYILAENPIFKNPIFDNKFFVCVDPLGADESNDVDCEECAEKKDSKEFVPPWLCGAFRFNNRARRILRFISMIHEAFSFSYKVATIPPRQLVPSVPSIKVTMPSPPEDMFTFKFFTLTIE